MKTIILSIFISINYAYSFDWNIDSPELSLSRMSVRGRLLEKSYGLGRPFPIDKYNKIKKTIIGDNNRKVEWILKNLRTGKIVDQHIKGGRVYYGASVAKVMTALVYYHIQGRPQGNMLQSILNMVIASDNRDWAKVQLAIGGGNSELSKNLMYEKTRELGFDRSRWFRGYMKNGLHGNELTVKESLFLIENLYKNKFKHGKEILKIMLCGQKGYDMSKKYLPQTTAIANKGGRYWGKTTNPYNGTRYNEDGSPYITNVRHQVLIFRDEKLNSDDYALIIHTNEEIEEVLSLIAGGLFNEHIARFK